MLTSTGKLVIGRLRPHFISVCQPDISFDNLSCGTVDNPTYITSFNCLGQDEEKIHDSRLSFPSGHSSAALYSMLFTAMYLQKRLPSLSSRSFTIMNQVRYYGVLYNTKQYMKGAVDVVCLVLHIDSDLRLQTQPYRRSVRRSTRNCHVIRHLLPNKKEEKEQKRMGWKGGKEDREKRKRQKQKRNTAIMMFVMGYSVLNVDIEERKIQKYRKIQLDLVMICCIKHK